MSCAMCAHELQDEALSNVLDLLRLHVNEPLNLGSKQVLVMTVLQYCHDCASILS